MKYYLITGASKGLGAALALELAAEGVSLITCSRSGLTEDQKLALIEQGAKVTDLKADLSQQADLVKAAKDMMAAVNLDDVEQVVLFNNAGGVEPIAPFHKADDEAVMANIALNFTAPMIMARHFGKAFGGIEVDRRIITVSSGAGKRPIFGWNSYCASKAAVDMMTRVIGLEEGEAGILAISFGPGIMDTDMQGVIRTKEAADFKDIETFKAFKENGNLLSAAVVAKALAKLVNIQVENGAIVSVQDYL